MRHIEFPRKRRGAIVPLVAFSLIALLGMVALAIDIGMIAIAKSHAQNAADIAAMAGTRTLNGDTANANNFSNAAPWARTAAKANTILTKPITDSMLTIDIGSYSYDYATDKFVTAYTSKPDTENWSLVRAKIQTSDATAFGRVFGVSSFNVSAVATAIHRPRDVAIVLDVGGSMRYDSLLGIPHSGNRVGTGSGEASGSNNPETVFPNFSAYSDTSAAGLQRTTAATINGNYYNLANITVETTSGPPLVDHFYQNTYGATPVKAFTSASDDYKDTPAGDMPKKNSEDGTTGTWVKTVNDLSNGGTAPTQRTRFSAGGTGFGSTFYSYTQGPRYWGKTFFIWPPDPRTTAQQLTGQAAGTTAIPDWRLRFFGTSNNSNLFDSSGNWKTPSGSTYTINYTEILKWIKMPYANSTATVFPPRMRSGRIIYYDAIPDTITGNNPTNANEKFWKKYIDYVLGVYYDGSNYSVITPKTGYGSDYSWGTPAVSNSNSDNPKRPRLHFWFGPMTMIDFLGNHNRGLDLSYQQHYWWPGTCTESPNYACKLGLQAGLLDIERNHPNDYVSLIMFSDPKYSATDNTGRFNNASVGMSRNYKRMIDSLWFPQSTIDTPGTEVRYDDANAMECPRAFGQTCFAMGFMLAYNQFSSNTTIRTKTTPNGLGGGYGRRGANRLVILETDGQANYYAEANFKDDGVTKAYYDTIPSTYPTQTGNGINAQVYSIVERMVAEETSGSRGYGTKRKPVLIHTVAYGTMFETYANDPDKTAALDLLQNIQHKGNTQKNASTALDSYKIITGTPTQRVDKMRQAFSTIMQDGVQISLIE